MQSQMMAIMTAMLSQAYATRTRLVTFFIVGLGGTQQQRTRQMILERKNFQHLGTFDGVESLSADWS
jgi:hypothetical protein